MDYAEMINMMTKQLKGIYANSPRKSYEIAYEGDTYAETLMDVDDTYKVLNGELYKCDDTQYPEDTSYLVDVRSNGDGTYKYIVQFYNGGTWLNEVLEEGLNNLK